MRRPGTNIAGLRGFSRSAAVKAFGRALAADSVNGRKKRGGRDGHRMSVAGRKAIAEAQRLRWQKIRPGKLGTLLPNR